MNSEGFFLNAKMGNDLLLAAAGEKVGGQNVFCLVHVSSLCFSLHRIFSSLLTERGKK